MMKKKIDSSRQYKQLQLEFDLPIHKRLAINLFLRVGQKGPPLGQIGLKAVNFSQICYLTEEYLVFQGGKTMHK